MQKKAKTGGSFVKGDRRAGRPKGVRNKISVEVRDLARKYGPAAIERLVELMHSKTHAVGVAACRELLDRGWGRPVQSHELSGPDGGSIKINSASLSDDQLMQIAVRAAGGK